MVEVKTIIVFLRKLEGTMSNSRDSCLGRIKLIHRDLKTRKQDIGKKPKGRVYCLPYIYKVDKVYSYGVGRESPLLGGPGGVR